MNTLSKYKKGVRNIAILTCHFALVTLYLSLVTCAFVSCSDKWDDHFATQENVSGSSLWDAISGDANLSNFASVLKACGYDTKLASSQTYTVFAPTNDCLSSAEAQSLIDAYNEQKNNKVLDDDNTTIRQFIQNQIALYRYSVSSMTNDSITFLNGKYKILGQNSIGNGNLLSKNVAVSNGVLFTVGSKLTYFPNIYEYLKMDSQMDSVYNFLSSYDNYEFQPSMSVAGSVNEDGETEYLDSVSVFSNSMLSALGYINREDSSYWFLAPTNSQWKTLYDEYSKYFNYANTIAKYDSLHDATTRLAIIMGSFFNKNSNPDAALMDSAVCTQAPSYQMRQLMDYGDQYVYYKPFASDGIFGDTAQVICSNGKLLMSKNGAETYRIDKHKTFCREIKVEAENLSYQDTLTYAESPVTIRTVSSDNPFYDKVSGNSYIDIVPKVSPLEPNKWPQPTVRFSVPNTLSNMKYDVYVVFAPVEAGNKDASAEDKLPNMFSGFVYYYNKDHKIQQKRISTKTVKTGVVDSVLVASDLSFTTAGYGLSSSEVKINLSSLVKASLTSQYSNTMHIDCIILKPKE